MKRGEVWWADFPFSKGGEIQKTRPAVIVSCDFANQTLNRVQIVPLTSNVAKIYPSETLVYLKQTPCKAMADQIQTATKNRLLKKIDRLSDEDMKDVEGAIKLQLGLR